LLPLVLVHHCCKHLLLAYHEFHFFGTPNDVNFFFFQMKQRYSPMDLSFRKTS